MSLLYLYHTQVSCLPKTCHYYTAHDVVSPRHVTVLPRTSVVSSKHVTITLYTSVMSSRHVTVMPHSMVFSTHVNCFTTPQCQISMNERHFNDTPRCHVSKTCHHRATPRCHPSKTCHRHDTPTPRCPTDTHRSITRCE